MKTKHKTFTYVILVCFLFIQKWLLFYILISLAGWPLFILLFTHPMKGKPITNCGIYIIHICSQKKFHLMKNLIKINVELQCEWWLFRGKKKYSNIKIDLFNLNIWDIEFWMYANLPEMASKKKKNKSVGFYGVASTTWERTTVSIV